LLPFVLHATVLLINPKVGTIAVPIGDAFIQAGIESVTTCRHSICCQHKQSLGSLQWWNPFLDKVIAENPEIDTTTVYPLEVGGRAADCRRGWWLCRTDTRVCTSVPLKYLSGVAAPGFVDTCIDF